MATQVASRPWEALPREVASALRPELPALAEEIVTEISVGVPEYARPIEGPFGRALRTGVEEALRELTELIEEPGRAERRAREVYVNLGRGEMLAGRSLDALLAAYRLGARIAWRRLAAAGERAGLEPRSLYLLAEAIFAYIDELSGDSIEGYTREQAAAAGELQRRRQRLVALLIQDPPGDPAAIQAAAGEAAWPLPRRLAAVAAEGEDAGRLGARLGAAALVAEAPPLICALIADPDAPGRRRELEAALGARRAALGPSVRWTEAGVSFARAAAALRVTEADGLVLAAEHRLPILLALDRRLSRDIAEDALEPLGRLRPAARERLTETLSAWLRHRGRTEEVARALHVHPQTIRYRLGSLRELFGDRLDDPDARFELELALRVPVETE